MSVWDDDTGADDQVGSALIKISALTGSGAGIDEWFPIQYKGKQSGTVHLKTVYTDYSKMQPKAVNSGGMQPMQQQMYQQPGMMPPQQQMYQQPMGQPGMQPMQQ